MQGLTEYPLGFGPALMRNENALRWFNALDPPGKQSVLKRSRAIKSNADMEAFVDGLPRASISDNYPRPSMQ
jgi:hypothetical protein